ncbi:MAG TPA: hypothetical protein VFM34_07980 [Moraxellaceae bacterium]|nr:hypothetical protein [Moraxellaceae bacterium]
MANPQSVIHGTVSARAALVPAALAALVLQVLWELPLLAATHGGIAFIGAWSFALVIVGLPLVLVELLMGRRSRRSPLEGLAVLTREADARRGWRAAAWGGALAVILVMAATALIGGGTVSFLARVAGVHGAGSTTGPVLPLGSAGLLVLAGLVALLPAARRQWVQGGSLALILVLMIVAAIPGFGMAHDAYPARALSVNDWREAFRLALLSLGSGLGLFWLTGMRLDKDVSLGRLAFGFLGLQVALGMLVLLAMAPFVMARLANTGGADIIPTGPGVWVVLGTVLLIGLSGLVELAAPVLLRLTERGMAPAPAAVLVFVGSGVLAEGVWLVGAQTGLMSVLTALYFVLLLVSAGLSVFAGWGMKVSHARKELSLPSEGIYNVWRVAVRLAVPLLILWVVLRPLFG